MASGPIVYQVYENDNFMVECATKEEAQGWIDASELPDKYHIRETRHYVAEEQSNESADE